MILTKPFDCAISNIKYRLGKYYVRMGLTPRLSKVRVCRDFSNPPLPQDPYVINEWPLTANILQIVVSDNIFRNRSTR